MADGYVPLTPQSLTVIDGLNELNRMLRELYENIAGDGITTKVLTGTGVPTIGAGEGSLFIRTDSGKLYQMRSSVWTEV
jgi:hypothetical protein